MAKYPTLAYSDEIGFAELTARAADRMMKALGTLPRRCRPERQAPRGRRLAVV